MVAEVITEVVARTVEVVLMHEAEAETRDGILWDDIPLNVAILALVVKTWLNSSVI